MVQGSFLGSLFMHDALQLGQKLRETLNNDMAASWVVLVEVIGGLPLPDHVVCGRVVSAGVVVVLPALNQQVPEPDSPTEASEVFHLDVVPPEEIEQLVGLGIVDRDDVAAEKSGIVGAV